ncbi:hypothetical protein B0J14DRAFT_13988 [Halenospora varia]|nr:hypothetical protein B0J14DRAFT_13988 [Halenospora varia]
MQLTNLLSIAVPLLLSVASANPVPNSAGNSHPNPTSTRKFTLAAFESPWPAGSPNGHGISGVVVQAKGGNFYINPADKNPPTTVFSVDKNGQAFVVSNPNSQVYLDTQTGALSYFTQEQKPAPGAVLTNFLHLGEGTTLTTPSGQEGFFNPGPGSFQWVGAINDGWMFCPRNDGKGMQVMKLVGGKENWNSCLGGYALVALDYTK